MTAKPEDPPEEEIMRWLAIDPATLMKEQSKAFDAKKWVWIPEAGMEGYAAVEIMSAAGDDITVKKQGGTELVVKKDKCEQMNPPKYEKCSDMANLTYLNEASVLYNLKARYVAGLLYTYSGLFCIAVNPYRRLPIYNDRCISMFRGKRKIEMPPHVFAIVDNAYQAMLQDHENQSMLITGESGAGKTENTKKVIMYIAKVAGVEKKPGAEEGKIKGSLDEQIVEANPLMEAFGNAKTVRNNNSSRFGKFIRAHFGQTGKLAGADIETYLLEKNRITFQLSAERNYHIFYQLLYATDDALLGELCLTSRVSSDYPYLALGVPTVDAIDDKEEYDLSENAIVVLGFSPDERLAMYKICAALLNLSNLKMKERPRDEQAEITDPSDGEKVSFCLGLNVGDLHKSLTKPRVKVGTEYVNKGQSMKQVNFAVGALSKAMYERMFLWQVVRINKALDTKERRAYFIGVLDIAGFEIFEYNSFDQLCINLTNEKLQQFFNHTMFVLEQEEYKKEGLTWDTIDFGMDLERTIDLIEKPGGIFPMLEEECIVPKATDQTYLQKMHKAHVGKHPSYGKPSPKAKGKDGDFILHHYAGSVGYSVAGWLEKNKDPVNEDTAGQFSKATVALVAELWADYNPDAGTRRKGSAFQTVSFRHREQLKILLTILGNTSPHFVRCIIPNETKSPGVIDGDLCLHQLRCNGVLEGIRICRKGFPSRMMFNDFRQRYQILAASAIPSGFIDGKVACEKLVGALQLDESEYRVGLTKVFFRAGIVGELEDMRDERLSKIISQFQAYCKGHLMRIEYNKLCAKKIAIAVMQRNVRKFFQLRNWTWWKLYIKVQPLLSIARAEDDMKEKEEELIKAKEQAEADSKAKADMESQVTDMLKEKEKMFTELTQQTESLMAAEEKLMATQTLKDSLEKNLNEALERLEEEEHAAKNLGEEKKKSKGKIDELCGSLDVAKSDIAKLEAERAARDKSIEGLGAEQTRLEEGLAKVGNEKKVVEESLQATIESLQSAEDKGKKLAKEKQKVESTLADVEGHLKAEKDAKAKLDKEKKKVEGTLRETEGKLTESEGALTEANDTIGKRDKALREAGEKADGLENTIKALQKKIAELTARIEELEEELDAEKKAKKKVESARNDLAGDLESLTEKLEEQGGATAAQLDVSKKREAEIGKVRKEKDEAEAAAAQALASAKAKAAASIAELTDEVEAVKKAKAKADKDKNAAGAEIDDLTAQLDAMKKKAAQFQKAAKAAEDKARDASSQISSLEAAVAEAAAKPSGTVDEATLAAATEAVEHKLGVALKQAKALQAQMDEQKEFAEAETKSKHDAQSKLKHSLDEQEGLQEQLDEESTQKAALASKLNKALADAAQWKNKYDVEGASRVDELEDAKKRLAARVQEMEEALAAAESKASGMEKVKNRMNEEVEDLLLDLEKAQAQASNLEKKQKKVDSQIGEWKAKCDDVQAELEKAQGDARGYSTELLKLRAAHEDSNEKADALKKENRVLAAEIADVTGQLSEGGKGVHEADKIRRKVEMEKEEIQVQLEEAETALEIEGGKLLKIQLELAQVKSNSDRKLQEKDEEVDVMRKNHQRQLESLQSMVDSAGKGSADMVKSRKKLEEQVADLEGHLENAGRVNCENQKTIKKLQGQIKDMGGAMDDESRGRDELRDAVGRAERKAGEMAALLEEAKIAADQAERGKKTCHC
jgi:myosin heavy subunit